MLCHREKRLLEIRSHKKRREGNVLFSREYSREGGGEGEREDDIRVA